MRAFFGWARRKGFILVDPTESDDLGFLEEPEREKQKLTLEQVNAFLKTLRENEEIPLVKRRLIEFWLWTGLRAWSEAASLRWEWVDWKTRSVYIPGENTKSRKGLKRALSDRAWEILEEMHLCRENGSPYVFVNSLTQKPFRDLRKTIQKLTKFLGLDKNITPKDFRHNFVSWTDGENALAAQEVIGHSGLMVEKRYFHMDLEARRQFENRISERMTGLEQNLEHGLPAGDANLANA
jgi:integrase